MKLIPIIRLLMLSLALGLKQFLNKFRFPLGRDLKNICDSYLFLGNLTLGIFQILGQICCKSKASPVDVAPAAAEGHVGCGGTASAASRGRSGAARPRDPLRLPLPWDHRGRARSAAPWPLF